MYPLEISFLLKTGKSLNVRYENVIEEPASVSFILSNNERERIQGFRPLRPLSNNRNSLPETEPNLIRFLETVLWMLAKILSFVP